MATALAASLDREPSVLRLRDGRALAYLQAGDPRGRPVFLFHGIPGSRLQRPPDLSAIATAGVRLVTVDRPGIGRSDPHPGRRLLDWPRDVAELADALGVRRFRVVGISGGGPYAVACAYVLRNRVSAVATVGGVAPFEDERLVEDFERVAVWFFRALRSTPRTLRATFGTLTFVMRRCPVPLQALLVALRCASDRAVLTQRDVRTLLCRDFREATHQGVLGMLDDARVVASPWGFDPAAVRTRVDVWHGTEDTVVRPSMGEFLVRALPHARRRFVRGGGHFSIGVEHLSEILAGLFEPRRRQAALAR
jgi:pimeloyl-ACP methyl ester carboxylesterase